MSPSRSATPRIHRPNETNGTSACCTGTCIAPIEVGTTINLHNVFFDVGKATLRNDSYPELNRVVALLNERPSLAIEVAGHTDNMGSDEANQKLSDDRAKAVMNYLIRKGIESSRLGATGYGESKPVASNDTEEGRQANRRVEFTITRQ